MSLSRSACFVLSALLLSAATAASAADEPPPQPEPTVTHTTPDPVVAGRLTVVPGLGINADPHADVDGLSLGVAGRADSLRGVEAQLFSSWVQGPVDGAQLSLMLARASDARGVQASGLVGTAHDVDGVQAAGAVAWTRSADVQAAGLVSVAREDVRAAQLSGVLNLAEGDVHGVQAAGIANVATGTDNRGVQLAGALNVAGDLEGMQASLVNVGKDVRGAQFGLLNISDEVDGLQIGLVNIAREADGVSIAPLNFIGNGLHHVDVWTSDSAVALANVKFGSRHVYTLLGAGYVRPGDPWWTWGGGFGVHLPSGPLWFEVDATGWGVSRGAEVLPGVHGKLRAQVGWSITRHFAPFVGVSANSWWGTGSAWPRLVGLPSHSRAGRQLVSWPGLHAGVQF